MIPLEYSVGLSIVMFCIGAYGVLARRNAVLILVSIELMLNAAILNLVAFSVSPHAGAAAGQVGAVLMLAIGAAEIGVGLAIVLGLYRLRETINVDEVDLLKW